MARSLWIRFATFLVWLLAAGCIVYWALKFVSGPAAPNSALVATSTSTSNSGAGNVDALSLAKGLGGGQAPSNNNSAAAAAPGALQASRFVLTGVVVQKSNSQATRQGVALIAVDGKPSRPYRVGSALADGVILHSVTAGKAMLATAQDAAPDLTLELPQLNTALVGNAVAARPTLPAPIFAAPAPMQTPVGMASTLSAIPSASVANPAANPSAVPGNRPPRPMANRPREAGLDAARDQSGPSP